MKILYLDEHLSCLNYRMNSDAGFFYQQLEGNDIYQIDNHKSACTLFMLDGEVIFGPGKYAGLQIKSKQMIFIPQNEEIQIRPLFYSKCIFLFWDKNVSVCDRIFFNSLAAGNENKRPDNPVLPIRKPLEKILDSVRTYLDARLLCKHMHLLKQQELLLVLRGFYSKSELEVFFFESVTGRCSFQRFVMENYKNVTSVKEFADLCNVSVRSFSRKFHSYFGETPYRWMQRKKAEEMLELICNLELSFQEISDKLGFSSPSHFTSYCRRVWGMSPSELRDGNRK